MTRETAKIKVELLDNYLSHTCQDYGERDHEAMMMAIKALEQEPILDKIKSDIAKSADTIPFVSGDIKAKYTNIGQHDGLEQALEIIEGNLKGDFDIDEWMAESE